MASTASAARSVLRRVRVPAGKSSLRFILEPEQEDPPPSPTPAVLARLAPNKTEKRSLVASTATAPIRPPAAISHTPPRLFLPARAAEFADRVLRLADAKDTHDRCPLSSIMALMKKSGATSRSPITPLAPHRRSKSDTTSFTNAATQLAEIGRCFYARGWALGTSGNFCAVTSREPLRLAITSTGLDKGQLSPAQFLEIDAASKVLRGKGQPSAEALLHIAVVHGRKAGAVLHTHSVWSTVLSGAHASRGGLAIEGYEMLKGLEGVRSHQHREWLPILENSQDMLELAEKISATLRELPDAHGFLLRQHGLYTWGASLQEAQRHVEILEFLMEVLVRSGGQA
jgi:methylthioribulose-1-phosphate dehydratase